MKEPDVALRLRDLEGRSMSGRGKPNNPCISAREAIALSDWVRHLRGELPVTGSNHAFDRKKGGGGYLGAGVRPPEKC
jgi:hypothetical protein